MSIKFFEVQEDGALSEGPKFTQDTSKVVIIVDDQFKRLFLWKGANSGIKKKFIGSRAAAELRKTYYGFAYRLSVIEEGDETQEFDFTLKRSRGEASVGVIDDSTRGIPTNPSEMGLNESVDIKLTGSEPSRKIIYTDRDKANITQFAGSKGESSQAATAPRPKRPEPESQKTQTPRPAPQRTILTEMMGTKEPSIIRPAPGSEAAKRFDSAPSKEPTPYTPVAQPKVKETIPTPPRQKIMTEVDPKEAFNLLNELGVPSGFERDIVIVGNGVYKQRGAEFLIPPDPPEGVFLAADRVPRIIIEKGVVKVIEILKRIEKGTKAKDEVRLDQDIEDLMQTFQIEIE